MDDRDEKRRRIDAFLESGALPMLEAALDAGAGGAAALPSFAGERIGPYRLLEVIGHGGMSVVYEARREDGEYDEHVAVKLLRHPGGDAGLVQRFRMERQILADLGHPNIARILDGGVTGAGWPYLVMERVAGSTLVEYARGHDLSERLRLFADVCAAVQHAHRHFVVHRDLKPSNILVTFDGEVKLLDFGIAKLLDEGAADSQYTLPMTGTGLRLMTPEYAAPEQLRGGTITTATDVYALGVLLYELLAGRRPYELGDASPARVEELVCEQDPPPPGAGGELDTICLKALRKEPGQRYADARELADDLERLEHGLPLRARPATAGYRLRKYVRRHRVEVAATCLVVTLSLAFGANMARQNAAVSRARDAAENEATRAVAVTDFLLDLFRAADPREAAGDSLQVRDLLERGVARADALADQPRVQADMLLVMGRAFRSMGDFARSEEQLRKAAALPAGALGDDLEAEILSELSLTLTAAGRDEEALETGLAALRLRTASHGPGHVLTAGSLAETGSLLVELGRYAEAESMLTTALEVLEREKGAEDPDAMTALNNLSDLYLDRGDYALAQAAQESVLARRIRVLGPDHYDVAIALNNLAVTSRRLGDTPRAEQLYRGSLAIKRTVHGGPHPDIARTLDNLGIAVGSQGRYDEAETIFREALDVRQQVLAPDHPDLAMSLNNLAVLMSRKGDYAAAEEYGRRALETGMAGGRRPPQLPAWAANRATSLGRLGRFDEALVAAEEAVRLAEELLTRESPNWTTVLGALAEARLGAGRAAEALEPQLASLEMLRARVGERHGSVATDRLRLGRILAAMADTSAATEIRAAVGLRRDLLGADHPQTASALHELGVVLSAAGDTAGAAAALDEALRIREAALGPDAAPTGETRAVLQGMGR